MNILNKWKNSYSLISKVKHSCNLKTFRIQQSNITTNSLPIISTSKLTDEEFDSVVLVGTKLEDVLVNSEELSIYKENNKNFEKELTFAVVNNKRVIYSPTGPLNRDYDDVRRIGDAAQAGLKKAVSIGSKKPLLVNCIKDAFEYSNTVSILGALEGTYTPLEVREHKNESDLIKVEKLGFYHEDVAEAEKLIKITNAVELGRIVAKDIGGSDPERMSASNVLKYMQETFTDSDGIKMEVIDDVNEFKENYPSFAAVNRAAEATERHRGKIIKLEYSCDEESVDETLFLVGKGITYDTGGADIKTGGNMIGMHRDKCGAAFVAGFFKTLALLKPKGLKVYGTMCLTRNNCGEDAYVADEIITARSKQRIRIGNTDAEGRMAIVDSLCEAKEIALNEKNPHLFTIATLTGHVVLSYGDKYTAVMSNGPAKQNNIDTALQNCGDLIADPYEISNIRREDYKAYMGKNEYEDQLQIGSPECPRSRGHQGPGAFLIMGSGLDKHGNDSKEKLSYSHVDIAGSSGKFPGYPSAAPLPSFYLKFIAPRI